MQSQIAEHLDDLNRWSDPFSVLAYLKNLSQDTATALVAQSYSTQRGAVSLLKPRVIVLSARNDMIAPYRYLLASPWKQRFSCLRSASSPEQMVEGIAVCDGEEDQRVKLADGRFESPWRFFRVSKESKKWAIESDIGLSAEGGACYGCHQGMPIVSGYPLWENWFLPIHDRQPNNADTALLLQFIKRNRSAAAQLLPDLSEDATKDRERVTKLQDILENGNQEMSDQVGAVNRKAFMSQLSRLHPEQKREIIDIWRRISERLASPPTSGDSNEGATVAKDLFGIIGQKEEWGQPTLEELNELEGDLSAKWRSYRDAVTQQRVRLLVSIASQWSNFSNQSSQALEQAAKLAFGQATQDVDILMLMMLKLLGYDPMDVLSAWSTARFPVSALEGRPMGEREEFIVWRVFGDRRSSPFAPQ